MASSSHRARARLRTTPLAVVTGLVAAVLMALTMSGTMSAFTASITNDGNAASTATLLMRQTGAPDATCYSNGTKGASVSTTGNTATCSTVNSFGGSLLTPNARQTTTMSFYNDGTVAASTFGLTVAGACAPGTKDTTAGNASDICTRISVSIVSGGKEVFGGSLQTLGEQKTAFALTSAPVKPGTPATPAVPVTVDVTTTLAAGASNDYQGLTATVPLTWTFTA